MNKLEAELMARALEQVNKTVAFTMRMKRTLYYDGLIPVYKAAELKAAKRLEGRGYFVGLYIEAAKTQYYKLTPAGFGVLETSPKRLLLARLEAMIDDELKTPYESLSVPPWRYESVRWLYECPTMSAAQVDKSEWLRIRQNRESHADSYVGYCYELAAAELFAPDF